MKVGTKILMGFTASCIIFLILSTVLFFLLRGAQYSSTALTSTIVPVGMAASDLQDKLNRASLLALQYTQIRLVVSRPEKGCW